jgi:hypothetical protein
MRARRLLSLSGGVATTVACGTNRELVGGAARWRSIALVHSSERQNTYMSRLWITWEEQRRNYSMAEAFGARLVVINVKASRLGRYAVSAWRTYREIRAARPSAVFVQNPSFVLVLVATLVCRMRGIPLVIDAHNSGVFPAGGRSRVLNGLTKWMNDSAALVIVSNDGLKSAATCMDANVFALPDPLPHIECGTPVQLPCPRNVLFICSWADDEPFLNVIEAARMLPADVCIHMTGNHRKRGIQFPEDIPTNINLTGFLSTQDYDQLLCSVDVVVDLTTRDDCLVCGAYEGIAARKPLVLSDWRVNRVYFNSGTLYTDNSAADIARCIEQALATLPQLKADIQTLAGVLQTDWDTQKHRIEVILAKRSGNQDDLTARRHRDAPRPLA